MTCVVATRRRRCFASRAPSLLRLHDVHLESEAARTGRRTVGCDCHEVAHTSRQAVGVVTHLARTGRAPEHDGGRYGRTAGARVKFARGRPSSGGHGRRAPRRYHGSRDDPTPGHCHHRHRGRRLEEIATPCSMTCDCWRSGAEHSPPHVCSENAPRIFSAMPERRRCLFVIRSRRAMPSFPGHRRPLPGAPLSWQA